MRTNTGFVFLWQHQTSVTSQSRKLHFKSCSSQNTAGKVWINVLSNQPWLTKQHCSSEWFLYSEPGRKRVGWGFFCCCCILSEVFYTITSVALAAQRYTCFLFSDRSCLYLLQTFKRGWRVLLFVFFPPSSTKMKLAFPVVSAQGLRKLEMMVAASADD